MKFNKYLDIVSNHIAQVNYNKLPKHMYKYDVDTLESILNSYRYKCFGLTWVHYVERKCKIPIFAPIIHINFMIGKILTLEQFKQIYFDINKEDLTLIHLQKSKKLKKALDSRLTRAYMSLIREYYICILLKEDGRFQNITFDIKNDILYGLDIIFTYDHVLYGAMIYQASKKNNKHLNRKRKKVKKVDRFIEISINVFNRNLHNLIELGSGKDKLRLPKDYVKDFIIRKIENGKYHIIENKRVKLNKEAWKDVF